MTIIPLESIFYLDEFQIRNLSKLQIIFSGGFIMDQIREFLPFIIPLIIAQLILLVIAFVHIFTHTNYKRGNRAIWVVVCIFGMEFIGPILYFILGKGEDE